MTPVLPRMATATAVPSMPARSSASYPAPRCGLGTTLLLMLMALLLTPAPLPAATGALVSYTTLPGAVASSSYTLKVNGTPVFVEAFGEVSVARFAFSGEIEVEIATSGAIVNPVISPQSYRVLPVVGDRRLRFALAQPRKLIVQISGMEKLLLFADAREAAAPRPGTAGVVSLADYLPPARDPLTPVTAAFQQAIDETSARNGGAGGTLYVPAGLYMSTQLRLKSNVTLYLHSGALVRAVPVFNSTNYPIQHGADSSFIYIANASNVRIGGRGVIDGNGFRLRSNTPGGGNCKLLRTLSARGVVIEDVYFRDSARWSLHFLHSDDIAVRNVKLVNDLRVTSGSLPFVTNTDGFDIDASTFVTVEDSLVYTTDDAFTPKVTGYMGVKRRAHDIVIRNNVIWTQKCALKVGDEVLDDIYNVRFDDNDTILADRFMALWNIGGNAIHHISARHNRTETIGVRDNKSFFYFYIRNQPGFVHDIEVNGLHALARAPYESRMEGYDATHPVSGFTVRNMYVAGVPMNTLADVPVVKRNSFVSNLSLVPPGADGPPLVQVMAADDRAIEGQDTAAFVFTRAGALDAPLQVDYTLAGSAAPGVDYAMPQGAVVIPAGAQQASLVLAGAADAALEGDETVLLSLADRSHYRRDTAMVAAVTVTDGTPTAPPPDSSTLPTVSVLVEDGSSSESQSPVNGGRFRLSRSGALDRPLTVIVSLSGSATNGVDYALLPTRFTIPAGSARTQVFVLPKADGISEPHEKLTLGVAADPAYRVGTAAATLTILNVDL